MLTLFKGWWNISNTATNICSYGEKSLDGSFSKLAVQQMGHLPLFLCSLTHFTKENVTFGNQVFLAAFFCGCI